MHVLSLFFFFLLLLYPLPIPQIDPNVVQCIVPDKKFEYLVKTFKPASVVPAALKVTDIAGLIKGASEGAGLYVLQKILVVLMVMLMTTKL